MIRLLTDHGQVSAAQGSLRRLLTERATSQGDLELGYQGGKELATVYALSDLELWVGFRKLHNRYWNAFGQGNPVTTSNRPIVVEINAPFQGVDRRIGGAFGVDESHAVYLLHRGQLRGGRKGVGKSPFLSYYRRWGALESVRDEDRETQAIVVAALDDPRALAHIASFVQTVARFKHELKQDKQELTASAVPATKLSDGFTAEFSGEKVIPPRNEIVARVEHGTIVNALAAELAARLEQRDYHVGNDQRDLFLRDGRGQVQLLFEVKPNFDSSSLYAAVGQLVLHASVTHPPMRVAVLPSETPDSAVRKLARRSIRVLRYQWCGQTVLFPELTSLLSETLKRPGSGPCHTGSGRRSRLGTVRDET